MIEIQFQEDFLHISDVLSAMRYREEETYKVRDYLSNIVNNDEVPEENLVNEACREKIADWFYQVIDYFDFNKIIANIAMSYLDKFLGTKEGGFTLCDRREYQLAAMCCLELAVKTHEPEQLGLESIVELCQGAYTESELKNKEKQILSALRWRMCPPTASCFAGYYLELLPHDLPSAVKEQISYLTMFQIENSIKNYSFLCFRPSEVAFASVLNAMETLQYVSYSLRYVFHANINIVARINPADFKINEIREKIRSPIQFSCLPSDKRPEYKNNVNDRMEYESNINVSPNCVRSMQA